MFCRMQVEKSKVGMDVLNDLIRKAELLNQFEKKHYALCSKTGFKQEVVELQKRLRMFGCMI